MGRYCLFKYGDKHIDIGNDSRFRLGRFYLPAVAQRRMGFLGGVSRYQDVVERVPIQIRGRSRALVMAAIQEILDMLDSCDRFYREETGDPVTWQFLTEDDTSKPPWECMLIRPVEGGLVFDRTLLDRLEKAPDLIVVEAELRFIRRGLWLRSTEESLQDTLGSSQTNSDTVMSFAAMVGTIIEKPTPIKSTWTVDNDATLFKGFMALGREIRLGLFTASGGDFSGSTTAYSGAIDNLVVQIAAAGTRTLTVSGLSSDVNRWYVFVKAYNTHASNDARLTLTIDNTGETSVGDVVLSPQTDTAAYVGLYNGTPDYDIILESLDETINVESVFMVAADDTAAVYEVDVSDPTSDPITLTIDHAAFSGHVPTVTTGNTADEFSVSGDLYTEMIGRPLQGLIWATGDGDLHFRSSATANDPYVTATIYWRNGSVLPL